MTNRTIEFSSHTGNLSLVRRFVREFLTEQGCCNSLIDLMVLGIDEACTNVIRYAYGMADDQYMRLSLESAQGAVRCRLRDYGTQPCLEKLNGRALEVVRPGGLQGDGTRARQADGDRPGIGGPPGAGTLPRGLKAGQRGTATVSPSSVE